MRCIMDNLLHFEPIKCTAFKFRFHAQGTEFFCDSPLNRCVCLTINVYKR